MAIAYHGSAALFYRFDPSHLLEGDGKFKFGVGAYLTSSYSTAAHYSGVSGSLDKYVYTVEIPDMTEDNYLHSLRPVHPSIIAKAEAKLGVSIIEEACQRGKYLGSSSAILLLDSAIQSSRRPVLPHWKQRRLHRRYSLRLVSYFWSGRMHRASRTETITTRFWTMRPSKFSRWTRSNWMPRDN